MESRFGDESREKRGRWRPRNIRRLSGASSENVHPDGEVCTELSSLVSYTTQLGLGRRALSVILRTTSPQRHQKHVW